MRKNCIIFSFVILIFMLVIFYLIPGAVKELSIKSCPQKISLSDFFSNDDNFYVYFYKEDCSYCENVSDDIKEFEKNNKVIQVNINNFEKMQSYDWMNHEKIYDIEIGEIQGDNIIFYDNYDKEMIIEKYPPLFYQIVRADYNYTILHEGKNIDKVYAIYTHPQLTKEDLKEENFILPGVPMLLEFKNKQVINYYFDDKEILGFLQSNKRSKDPYWVIS